MNMEKIKVFIKDFEGFTQLVGLYLQKFKVKYLLEETTCKEIYDIL